MNNFTHLQFADDTMIFLSPEADNIVNIKRILQCFQLISGLKINFSKSSLFSWDNLDVHDWSDILGCRVCDLPIKYLVASIGTNPRRKVFWKPLIEKFEKKLAGWKCSYLNQAGRRVLVKSYLNGFPTYWFHLHGNPSWHTFNSRQDKEKIGMSTNLLGRILNYWNVYQEKSSTYQLE